LKLAGCRKLILKNYGIIFLSYNKIDGLVKSKSQLTD